MPFLSFSCSTVQHLIPEQTGYGEFLDYGAHLIESVSRTVEVIVPKTNRGLLGSTIVLKTIFGST